ncbi:MAG: hypothetical protein IKN96_03910 [Oscillibacter sp.]|nr:hypothetical protein [Oscillibacter sp.]
MANKLFVWLLSAALCAGLTACGSDAARKSTAGDESGAAQESATDGESGVTEEALLSLFNGMTGYGRSAGSSLRNAENARNLLEFAERTDYANANIIDRAQAVAGAYSAMSDENREEFLYNYGGVRSLTESAFKDYESVRGLFDDAGIADAMEDLLNADGAREQWDALLSDIPSSAGR